MIIHIPESFRSAPFFRDVQELTVSVPITEDSFPSVLEHIPFYYDLTGEEQPWLNKRSYVPELFRLWKETEPHLAVHYHNRQPKAAKETMIMMIAVYIDSLFWSHNKQVTNIKELTTSLKELHYKPFNCEERLAFLLSVPERYHAYVQLKALFTEQEKIYAKILTLEQFKSKRGN